MHFITSHPFFVGFLVLAMFYLPRLIRRHGSAQEGNTVPQNQAQQDYGIACRTTRGERVRSKAECFLANYLHTRGFKYLYEEPFLLKRRGKTFRIRPDFYLPEFDLLIEYWGLINIKPEYAEDMRWKMALYHGNQIRFISIYPDNMLFPFDPMDFDALFQHKFQTVTGVSLRSLTREALTGMACFEVIHRLESKRASQPIALPDHLDRQ